MAQEYLCSFISAIRTDALPFNRKIAAKLSVLAAIFDVSHVFYEQIENKFESRSRYLRQCVIIEKKTESIARIQLEGVLV